MLQDPLIAVPMPRIPDRAHLAQPDPMSVPLGGEDKVSVLYLPLKAGASQLQDLLPNHSSGNLNG